jgi:hypothetical protein
VSREQTIVELAGPNAKASNTYIIAVLTGLFGFFLGLMAAEVMGNTPDEQPDMPVHDTQQ